MLGSAAHGQQPDDRPTTARPRLRAVGDRLQIEQKFRSCVCFLMEDAGDSVQPVGTGFFVRVASPDPLYGRTYVVTAHHVAFDQKRRSPLLLTADAADGGIAFDFQIPNDAWIEHPNNKTDPTDVAVAVVPDEILPQISGRALDASKMLIDQSWLNSCDIGCGQEVFAIGMFTGHIGKNNIQPIHRFGKIALMPAEKIDTPYGSIEAYLVEMVSWGGESGSPVFDWEFGRECGHVLGVLQGHWLWPQDVKWKPSSKVRIAAGAHVEVNHGLSIVVPAYKITELLMTHDTLREDRESAYKRYQSRRILPKLSGAQPDGGAFGKASFDAALRKASRRKPTKREKPSGPEKEPS